MRLTVLHVVVLLAAAAHVVESAKFLTPHIVLDIPYTEFDSSTGMIQVIAGTEGIKLRCVLNKLETIKVDKYMQYHWAKTITGQPGHTSTGSQSIAIKEYGSYGFKCQVGLKDGPEDSDYSYPATILVLGGPPLGSHPKVTNYTSISVDVSWKKPTTFTTDFTDYDIKISPIYAKESASAVMASVENPTTRLSDLQPRTIYEVTVRTRVQHENGETYGDGKKQLFVTKDADAANQKEISLVSIVTCFILSLCVTF